MLIFRLKCLNMIYFTFLFFIILFLLKIFNKLMLHRMNCLKLELFCGPRIKNTSTLVSCYKSYSLINKSNSILDRFTSRPFSLAHCNKVLSTYFMSSLIVKWNFSKLFAQIIALVTLSFNLNRILFMTIFYRNEKSQLSRAYISHMLSRSVNTYLWLCLSAWSPCSI